MEHLVLTGASGSGKTAIGAAFARRRPDRLVWHGDSLLDAVKGRSPEALQRALVEAWFARLKVAPRPVLLEVSAEIGLVEAVASVSGVAARIVLLDVDWEERRRRLADRGQPELGDKAMLTWSAMLRRDAEARGHPIIDTTGRSIASVVEALEGVWC